MTGRTVLLDFETVSRCDLKRHGGRIYAAHPSTAALCCVLYDVDTGDVTTWTPGEPCPVRYDDRLGAHNADMFDRFIAGRVWGPTFAEGARWIDTSIAARRAGLPGALDELGMRWLGREKDKVASAYTVSLSRFDDIADACPPLRGDFADARERNRARTRQRKEWRAMPRDARADAVRATVMAYCASDVEIMADGWADLRPWWEDGVFGGWEGGVLRVDRVINERGFDFDVELAQRLLECDARASADAIDAAARTSWRSAEDVRAIVSSPAQFTDATGLPNAQALTLEKALASEDTDEEVRALCRARQALATIAKGKLEAGLARVSPDGRIRDWARYCGAHTYRWSHKGLQPGNLPRPEKEYEDWGDDEVCALVDRVMAGAQPSPGETMVALRACLGVNAVCDLSGVEARCTAWVAHDQQAIDVFLSGRDVYKVNATTIFPGLAYEDVNKVQRTAGKMGELACGYQGGRAAVLRIATANGVDLIGMGVDVDAIVEGWRKLHPKIVRLWRDLQAAFLRAADGHATRAYCFDFVPSSDGRDVAVWLPSGRPIVYGNVGVSAGKFGPEAHYVGGWGTWWKCAHCGETARAPLDVRLTDRADCPASCGAPSGAAFAVGPEKLYGGLLTENVVQAMCRDLLADALVRAEDAGLRPVLHVHDEIGCDQDEAHAAEAADELHQIMTTLPEWARGFPIGASKHHGRRYRK